jgi:hypothetical protein
MVHWLLIGQDLFLPMSPAKCWSKSAILQVFLLMSDSDFGRLESYWLGTGGNKNIPIYINGIGRFYGYFYV